VTTADAVKVCFVILSTLFPIVNPLSGSPLFLALTEQYSLETRRKLSWRVALDSLYLMLGSYFIGAHVLRFFGVSLPVVQVGGGLVVVAMGWRMLQQEQVGEVSRATVDGTDVFGRAFYPLTMPLTVGPGSISVAVTLGANSTHVYGFRIPVILAAIGAISLIAVSIAFCYLFAEQLEKRIGRTGMAVIVRLSAFLLVCIGVQIMWNGVSALLSSIRFQVH